MTSNKEIQQMILNMPDQRPLEACQMLAKTRYDMCFSYVSYLGAPPPRDHYECDALERETFVKCIKETSKWK